MHGIPWYVTALAAVLFTGGLAFTICKTRRVIDGPPDLHKDAMATIEQHEAVRKRVLRSERRVYAWPFRKRADANDI